MSKISAALKLQDLIDEAIRLEAEDEQPREYIGASIIAGQCERALWYGFRWYDRPDFPPRIYRRFETGNVYEDRVVRRLEQTGRFRVRAENPRARNPKKQYSAEYGPLGGLLRGHMDGFLEATDADVWAILGDWNLEPALNPGLDPVLLEVKALASAKYHYAEHDHDYLEPIKNKTKGKTEGRWFELVRTGLAKAQQTHFGQMQAYMGFSRSPDRNGRMQFEKWGLSKPLNWGLYVGVNGDTDQWYAEIVRFSQKWFDRILERATRVIRTRKAPDRISNNPASWDCRFCDFHGVCHEQKPPIRSCRSCEHADLRIPGDPKFFGSTATWFCTKHNAGCGDYTPCDHWRELPVEEEMF